VTRLLGVERRILAAASASTQSVNTAIEEITQQLLGDSPELPIEPRVHFRQLGIVDARSKAGLPVSGKLERTRDGLMIVYAAHMRRPRIRFTIAHELGHAFLEGTGRRPPRRGAMVERLCDQFAASLLMPRDSFLRATSPASVANLLLAMETFETSLEATAMRMAYLLDCTVIYCQGSQIRWSYGGLDTREAIVRDAINAAQTGDESPVFLHGQRHHGYWRRERDVCLGGEILIFVPTSLAVEHARTRTEA
jgi:hypothetical protein